MSVDVRQADCAELVAFDVLEPALRSRGGITDRAKQLQADEKFRETMTELISGTPAGRLVLRTLSQAWERLDSIEERLRKLEERLER